MAEVKEKIAQEEAAKKKKDASAGEGDGGTTPSSAASAAAAKEAEAAKKSALEAAMAATLAAYAPKAGQAAATMSFCFSWWKTPVSDVRRSRHQIFWHRLPKKLKLKDKTQAKNLKEKTQHLGGLSVPCAKLKKKI